MHALPRLQLVLILFLAAMSAGCGVSGVAWLPDSSGFVYPTGENNEQLSLFDLSTRKEQVLVKKTESATIWPAVSPDGKQVATARLVREKDVPEKMQIIIYDLKGKEQHRSPEFVWCEPPEDLNTVTGLTGLFWKPDGTRLVVYDFGGTTGIYDVGQKRITLLPGHPLVFATNSVRPDGKGFLIANGDANQISEVAFVDWEGKKQKIDMKPDTLDTKDKHGMIEMPFAVASFWQGDTAVVTFAGTSIHIDTNKRVGTCHKVPQEETKVGQMLVHQQYTFPNKGARVRSLMKENDDKDKKAEAFLEVLKPGQERPKILRESGFFLLFPSPDGKHLAISYENQETENLHILVLDSAGEVVADINVKGSPNEIPVERSRSLRWRVESAGRVCAEPSS